NTGSGFNWVINDTAIEADFTGTGAITSTSGGNHMLLFGDQFNVGGGAQNMDAYFQTDAIDLTGVGSVEVEFQQKFRICCAAGHQLSLFVSNDNTTWTEFDVRGGVAINAQSADPDLVTVDITCVAANQATVYLRWHKIGASHYFWMVDDILIREIPPGHDLSVENVFYLDPWLTPPYSKIPVAQADTSMYTGIISNNLLGDETGVNFNVTVNDGTNDVYNMTSGPVSILGCVDSTNFTLSTGWLATNVGNYTITMEVSADSTDSKPLDNTVVNFLEVTDTIFARDNNIPQFALNAASYAVAQPYGFGVWYELPNAETATSISVQLGANTVVNSVIQGSVMAGDLTTVLETTSFYTVVAADLGNWVTLKLDAPLAIAAQSNVVAVINEFAGNDTALTIQATGAIDQMFATSYLFFGGGQNSPIAEVPFIRLNVSAPATVCNLTATAPTLTAVSCAGMVDGAISGVVPSGGTAPYSYLWSPGGFTGADTSSLPSGVYTLQITDAAGCTYSLAATVTEPDALTVAPSTTDITCNGDSNGVVIGGATGGNLLGTPAVVNFFEDFEGGTTMPAGFATFDVDGLTPNVNVAPLGFDGTDATAWVIADDGSGANNVAVSNSWYTPAGTSDDWMITAAINIGASAVLSWDANAVDAGFPDGYEVRISTTTQTVAGCQANASLFTIAAENPAVTARTVDLTAAGYANQTVYIAFRNISTDQFLLRIDNIKVEAPAVASAYQYSFDGSAYSTTTNYSGLGAGTYSIKVKDASGCEDSTTVTVTEPAAMGLTFTQTTANCGVGGSATVTVVGGLAPYTYSWDDPQSQTGASATGLVPGSYICTVIDSNGCIGTAVDSVLGTPPVTVTIAGSDPTACGVADGIASVVILSGTGPYNYIWDDPGSQASDSATGLGSGVYNVTITDFILCQTTATVTLTDVGAATLQMVSTNIDCMGDGDGTIGITAFGNGPFAYIWNTTPVQTVATAVGLAPGNYFVTVTDAGGCKSFADTVITEPSSVVAVDNLTQSNVSCNGATDGSLTVSASGGTAPLSYQWTGGPATPGYNGLDSGTYVVTITDANNCTATTSGTITEPAAMGTSTSPVDVNCFGDATGSITLTVTGGATPYTFAWDNGGGTNQNVTSAAAGNYQVTVTDANGCTSMTVGSIGQPAFALVTTAVGTDETASGASDGSITATADDGTPPYQPSWTGPAGYTSTSLSLSGLAPGQYILNVTDANGCVQTEQVTIAAGVDAIGEIANDVVFKIYPNPNTGQFIVELNNLNNEVYQLEIRNILGQVTFSENVNEKNGNFYQQVDLTSSETGVYFISLTNDEGKITKKLVVY
ncbi:MAG: T9SS type A sorting domain-containing protein, partial [Flavobacteriales bacterium]|nr:T9SS type A sorting domain-containing protein [Flavobacteriales bacterium]